MALEPGWYPDPDDGNLDRYWGGTAWATGEGTTRGESPRTGTKLRSPAASPGTWLPVNSATPPPSAPLLAVGFVGLVLGQLIQLGGGAAAQATLFSTGRTDAAGLGMVVVGSIIALASLVVLAVGVYRMAVGIDHLVRLSAERDT